MEFWDASNTKSRRNLYEKLINGLFRQSRWRFVTLRIQNRPKEFRQSRWTFVTPGTQSHAETLTRSSSMACFDNRDEVSLHFEYKIVPKPQRDNHSLRVSAIAMEFRDTSNTKSCRNLNEKLISGLFWQSRWSFATLRIQNRPKTLTGQSFITSFNNRDGLSWHLEYKVMPKP